MKTLTSENWVDTASTWELEAEKKAAIKRISDLWADPDMSLARDRYERHDRQIDLIRRIDERLAGAAAGTDLS